MEPTKKLAMGWQAEVALHARGGLLLLGIYEFDDGVKYGDALVVEMTRAQATALGVRLIAQAALLGQPNHGEDA